jgi:L-asparagine permease
VIWRIAIFYVGSVTLLAMLLPSVMYSSTESPFVTVFTSLGLPWVGDLMNAIVLTAALSSCNSGLYSTGRVLRSLADKKEAPAFAGKMSSRHVPYGGILFTSVIYVAGVALNQLKGATAAFDIATAIASLGVVATWATLVFCQLRLRQKALAGELERPSYRMPGAPWTGWLTLGFLALIVVMMGFAGGAEQVAFFSIPGIAAVIAIGWWAVSRRRRADESDPSNAVPVGGQ